MWMLSDPNRIIIVGCSCASSGNMLFQCASTEAEPRLGRICQAGSINVGCNVSTHYFLAGKKGGCSIKMRPTATGATVTRGEADLVSAYSYEFDSELNVPASWIQECGPGLLYPEAGVWDQVLLPGGERADHRCYRWRCRRRGRCSSSCAVRPEPP